MRLTMRNLPPIYLQSLQNTWNCMLLLKVTPTTVKWLNRARFARCQPAQKPRIKNPKTSNRSQRQYQPMTRVSLWSVLLKRIFIHKEHELVVSPYEADNAEFTTYISTEPPKYVKLHFITESNPNLCEMTEQSSLCSLPTGSETSNQKSENVKSFATPMSTNNPSFVLIGCIKTQLHPQGTWTCGIPLRSHIHFIVGPTGPN